METKNYTTKDLNKAVEALPKEWRVEKEKVTDSEGKVLKNFETYYLKKGHKCFAIVKTETNKKVNIENIDMYKHSINVYANSILTELGKFATKPKLVRYTGEKTIAGVTTKYWLKIRSNGKVLISVNNNTFFVAHKNKGKVADIIWSHLLQALDEDTLTDKLSIKEEDFNEIKDVVEILDQII